MEREKRDEQREVGVAHPDLVLQGQEEHPLLAQLPPLVVEADDSSER